MQFKQNMPIVKYKHANIPPSCLDVTLPSMDSYRGMKIVKGKRSCKNTPKRRKERKIRGKKKEPLVAQQATLLLGF